MFGKKSLLLGSMILVFVSQNILPADDFIVGDSGRKGSVFSLFGGSYSESLGGAFVTGQGHPESIFYNPAQIIENDYTNIYWSYNKYYVKSRYNQMSVIMPLLFSGALALSYYSTDFYDIENRDIYNTFLGYYSDNLTLITFSYSNNINKSSAMGFSIKYINRDLYTITKKTFSLDLGLKYRLARRINLGFNIQNAIPIRYRIITENEEIPTNILMGFNIKFSENSILYCQWKKPMSDPIEFMVGFKQGISKNFSVTVGRNPNYYALGITYNINRFEWNVLLKKNHFLGYTISSGLVYRLGVNKKVRKRQYFDSKLLFIQRCISENKLFDAKKSLLHLMKYYPKNREVKLYLKRINTKINSIIEMKLNIQKLLSKGKDYFDNNDFVSAKRIFKKIIMMDNTNVMALKYLNLIDTAQKKKNKIVLSKDNVQLSPKQVSDTAEKGVPHEIKLIQQHIIIENKKNSKKYGLDEIYSSKIGKIVFTKNLGGYSLEQE